MLHKMVCKNTFVFVILFLSIIDFLAYPAANHAADISGAEYFFDNDPGQGNGIFLPAADGSFDSAEETVDLSGIDTTGLKIGDHNIYVRFMSADGVWGMARPVPLDPLFRSPFNFRIRGEKWVKAAEYFIDDDPGPGNGIPAPAADGEFNDPKEELGLADIDISYLSAGAHTLYLRLQDNEGTWGIIREVLFEIYEPFTIAGAEYFIDDDPGPGNGTAMAAKDGSFDSAQEQVDISGIDTTGLSEGVHTLYVRFKDQLDRWGALLGQSFAVGRPVAYICSDPVQPATGDGRMPISVVVADQSGSNTCMLKAEYAMDGSDEWRKITIEQGSVAASYGQPALDNGADYQIGNSSGWIETSSGSNTISFVWLSKDDLDRLDGGNVCLRFTIHNGNDEQITSAESLSFSLDNLAPDVPIIIPYTPDPTGDTTPTLQWSPVGSAARYHLQIASDSTFDNLVLDEAHIPGTTFTLPTPLPYGLLYWRISAIDALGNESAFSIRDSFTLSDDVSPPTVSLSYSASSPVSAGPVTLTAVFSEPLATTPLVTIDQPGSVDLDPVEMIGSGSAWRYTYWVDCADGDAYKDGAAFVTITSGFDYAGNENTPAENSSFEIDTSACGSGNIAAAEYFFDSDPGEGSGVPISAADGSFDSSEEAIDLSEIDTSGLKIGDHTLYVRFKSADGVWGMARPVSSDPLFRSPFNFRITGEKWIAGAEYFIDVDPGEGNGVAVPVADGEFDNPEEELALSGIDISSLSTGTHTLYLRIQNNEGTWGVIRKVTFEIYEPETIAGAEYFIDNDPCPGSGTPLAAKDGEFDSAEEEIDISGIATTGLSEGVHTLYVRFKDSLDRWGTPLSRQFGIGRPIAFTGSTPVQPATGDGRIPLSVVVADQSGSNTCMLKIECAMNGSDNWQLITIEEGSVSAIYGSPILDNSAEYQIGGPGRWIETGSGSNTISFVWLSNNDLDRLDGGNIRLRFTIHNGNDEQITSAESLAFALDNLAPEVPILVPYTPDPTGDTTPTLQWMPVGSAERYHLQIASDSTFNNLIFDEAYIGEAIFTLSTPLPHGLLYWRISAIDALGNESAFSILDSFAIVEDAEPPSVTLSYSPLTPVSAGPVTITAFFSEPLATVPLIEINQQGSVDLDPVEMIGSGFVWSYTYLVDCADGNAYKDGAAFVTITNGFDYAGNENAPAENNSFDIDTSACGSGNIIAAEYFFDNDPGEGNGISLSAADGAFDSSEESVDLAGIDTSSLKIGPHTLYVRFKSADGIWGMARPVAHDPLFGSPYNFSITGEKWIAAAEYFIDVDPGKGHGIQVPAADGAFDESEEDLELSGIDVSYLAAGPHTLYLRVQDNEGTWGIVRQVSFEIYEPFTISGAEYFIDNDPGPGSGTPVSAKDGSFDSAEEQVEAFGIDTTDLIGGYHILYVRFQDSLGRWGALKSTIFNIINDSDDQDGDGMPNGWELTHGLNPLDPSDALQDPDNDGLTNLEEYECFTNPHNPDSDGDGMPDGWEALYGLNPNIDDADLDPDNDGLSNLEEYHYWTDPANPDTDGDGINDGDEVANGTDPRAMTSSLISDTPDLTLSIGSSRTVILKLANNSRLSDTFEVSVTGVGEDWYSLGQTEVVLSAGEVREIVLEIHVPEDCDVEPPEYEIDVAAVSPISGPVANGGVNIPLHVVVTPIISEVLPQDGEKMASNSVRITWQTDVDAGTELYYKIAGTTEYSYASGDSGKTHWIVLEDLGWDNAYEWYAVSNGPCGASQTQLRTFFVQDGVVFEERESSHDIFRDYDQQVTLTIWNRDVVSHTALVEIINPYDDLIAGFVGSGSQDETLTLDAGEESEVTLALHAQDAENDLYVLTLKLTADAESDNPIVDYTHVTINVVNPVFDLTFVEIGQNPAILTNTYRITNNGDTITDLRVFAEEAIAPQIVFQPKIDHMRLRNGESIEFSASFAPAGQVSQYTGILTAAGAGQHVTLPTHFGCPDGTSLYTATLYDTYVCLKASNWYCNNRPNISMSFGVPRYVSPENITRSRLYCNFSLPWSRSSYKPHNVTIKFNGEIISTLTGVIPEGGYAFEISPSLINTGEDSVGRNRVILETRHGNQGHYVVASEFELILDIDELTVGSVCATSQENADQAAQNLPYLCDGEPDGNFCPRLAGVTPLNENGTPQWNFNPGEAVQVRVSVMNPDLDQQSFNIDFVIDDDFGDGNIPFEQSDFLTVAPGGAESLTFWWTIPEEPEAKFYHTKTTLSGPDDCADEGIYSNAIAVNQPVIGYVNDNETGFGLEGVEVRAFGFGPGAVYSALDTTDENGMFTIYLPEGKHMAFAWKDGYSTQLLEINTADPNPTLILSNNSAHLGDDDNAGHAQDPVNTALGNFTLDHYDLSFKGRGLNVSFARFYNSIDTYQGPLGFGWTHNYNLTLNIEGGVAIIKFGDGRDEFYVEQGDGSFESQPGVHNIFARETDGTFTLTDTGQTVRHWDAAGRLTSIVDKNGNTISLAYQNDLLVTVTDPVGREVHFTYDAEGRITQLEDPLGRTVCYVYDENGDLVSSFDPMDHETTYTYDTNHQMLTATDSKGNVFVSNTYDGEKRVVTAQSDALGNISHFFYDEQEHVTTIVDALGHETVHKHDNRNRLVNVIDPLRNAVAMEYDNDNNRTCLIDKLGNITRFEYDTQGNVTRIIDALAHETSIVYDDKNNPLEKTDALGRKTAFEYDNTGNLVKIIDALLNETTIVVNEFGQPTSVTDARNNTSQNTYDTQGNLIETRDALNYTVTMGYDAAGRIISVTDQRGHITAFAYDAKDNLTTTTDPAPFGYTVVNGYDLNGNRVSVKDKRGYVTAFAYDQKNRLESVTDPLTHAVNYVYDALDRKILQTDKRGKNTAFTYNTIGNLTAVTDALSNTVHNSYDANGNLTRRVDPTGRAVSNSYDELNRLVRTEDALVNRTEYAYDALGRVSGKTDANDRITRYEYDELGRLAKVIEPGNIETLFEYDEVGNKVGFTNGKGNIFTYEYDALNRMTSNADGYQYEYDGSGNLTTRTDAKGQMIVYQYDELNRLTLVRYPDAGEVSFAYDANGNPTSMVDPLGTTSSQYDELNRLVQSNDPFGKVVGFGYDESGNRTAVTYPDNSMVQYSYDDLNRLQAVTDWADRITAYSYDNSGRLVGMTYPNGSTAALSYDDAGRFKTLANNKPNSDIICNYSFTLDPVGNRTLADKTEPLVPFIKDASITYQYDADNRITAITDGAVTFDANGSIISKTEGAKTFDFSWNYENRLQQIEDGTHTVNYVYDGRNNRLACVKDGVTTRYVLDTGTALPNVLAETDETGNITSRYIYGLGLIAQDDAQGVHYYHYDALGSTIALSNESGEVTDKYAYDPFGGLANRAGSTENPFTFVGRFGLMDEGDGLYYVRARYYDSEIGRFLNKDLILGEDTDPRSLHRYVYVMNGPVGLVDVSGLCGEDGGTDSWWYKATDWVDPLVGAFETGYEKAKDFGSLFTNKAGWKAAGEGWKNVSIDMISIFYPDKRSAGQEALVNLGEATIHFSAGVILELFAGGTAGASGALWYIYPNAMIPVKLAISGTSQINEASVDLSLSLENTYRYFTGAEARTEMNSNEGIFGSMIFIFEANTAMGVGGAY